MILPAFLFGINQSKIKPMIKISRQRERGKKKGPTIFLNRNIYHYPLFILSNIIQEKTNVEFGWKPLPDGAAQPSFLKDDLLLPELGDLA
jgi:hypothetical protein